MDILVARDLARSFGPVHAVENVSISVHAGEIVGLLGPNGAGKTTTLRMLAGILTPERGDVRICGIDVHSQPLEAKRRLGFLSGDTHLYQRLTPVEVLTYFGRLYGVPDERIRTRIAELVAELEMESFKDRPCSTLDVVSGQFVAKAIRRKRDEGRAVLFSTHIMSEAEYLCDRIALVHAGRIIDEGTLPELLDRSGQQNLTDAFLHHVSLPSPQGGCGEAGA
jgi:sodium transport system ATP-binding protein